MKKMNVGWRWLLGLSLIGALGMPGADTQAQGVLPQAKAEKTMMATRVTAPGQVVAAVETEALPTEKVSQYRRRSKSAQTDTVRFTAVWPNREDATYPVQIMLEGVGEGVIDWGDGRQSACMAFKDDKGDYRFELYEHLYTEPAENDEREIMIYTSSPDLQITGLQLYYYTNYEVYTLHRDVDVRFCPSLKYMYCAQNRLGSLDLSQNAALMRIDCTRCSLTSLLLPPSAPSLEQLSCGGNQLTSLNISAYPTIATFHCWGNQLGWADLDAISQVDFTTFEISPQHLPIAQEVNGTVDLTAYDTYNDQQTVYNFGDVESSLYTFEDGILRFRRIGNYTVSMSNPAVKKGDDPIRIDCNLTIYPKKSDTVRWVWHVEADKVYQIGLDAQRDAAFWVQWGDGQPELVNGETQIVSLAHTYENAGEYEVKIYGTTSYFMVLQLGISELGLSVLDVRSCPSLEWLNCNSNQLTTLDVSKNTELKSLFCANNQLTALDVSKNTELLYLDCYTNQLTALDVSKSTALQNLYCQNNQLTALNVAKNTALQNLSCYNNPLTSLDVAKNTALRYMDCDNTQLTALNVSKNTELTQLYCNGNQLKALDVTKNTALQRLSCNGNQLTALDVTKNTALADLYCHENQLPSLDVTKNTALTRLDVDNNRLAALDVSKNTALQHLSVNNNRLTALDVSENAALTDLYCSGNQLVSLDLSALSQLETVYCGGNVREVPLDGQNAFDLSTLPGFDVSKMTDLSNGELEEDGTRLIFEGDIVYYDYAIGWNDQTERFTLRAIKADEVQIPITAKFFPDDVFRAYVAMFDRNGNDSLGEYERLEVYTINVGGTEDNPGGIKRLDGLKYFENLQWLNCQYNALTALNISENAKLIELACDNNNLTTLDLSKNDALSSISCKENRMPLSTIFKIQSESTVEMTCTPQRIPVELETRQSFNLKSEMQIDDVETEVDFGTIPTTAYTFKSDKLSFKKSGKYQVSLTNEAVRSMQENEAGESFEGAVTVFYEFTVTTPADPEDPEDPNDPNNPDHPDDPDQPSDTTAIEGLVELAPFAYVQGRTVYLTDGLGEVEVFTAVGQRIYRGRDRAITLPRQGVYMLRAVADGHRCKVAVR